MKQKFVVVKYEVAQKSSMPVDSMAVVFGKRYPLIDTCTKFYFCVNELEYWSDEIFDAHQFLNYSTAVAVVTVQGGLKRSSAIFKIEKIFVA